MNDAAKKLESLGIPVVGHASGASNGTSSNQPERPSFIYGPASGTPSSIEGFAAMFVKFQSALFAEGSSGNEIRADMQRLQSIASELKQIGKTGGGGGGKGGGGSSAGGGSGEPPDEGFLSALRNALSEACNAAFRLAEKVGGALSRAWSEFWRGAGEAVVRMTVLAIASLFGLPAPLT